MQGEKRYKSEKEIQEAVRNTPTVTAAARLLGIGLPHVSERLNSPGLRAWWTALKARRKQLRSAARRRATWNRTRDRRLLAWLSQHREGAAARRYLSTRLRARVERALAAEGIVVPPLK